MGSTLYIAPEMLLNEGVYDQQADCWSLGVCSFMLLCGAPPFWDGSFQGTMELVKKGEFAYPAGKKEVLSSLAVFPQTGPVGVPDQNVAAKIIIGKERRRPHAWEGCNSKSHK